MKAKSFFVAIFIAMFSMASPAQVGTEEAAPDSTDKTSTSSSDRLDRTSETTEYVAEQKPCRWWRRHCHAETEGLPPEAPTTGVVITVDTTHNIAYLWRDGELLAKAPATTGSDKTLKRGLKQWLFRTPRGRHPVISKVKDPIWTKPDWAFIEEGKPVPPPNSPARKVRGHLGKYALHLGDGILIHGTKETKLLGRKGSHGCIRLGAEMLELVYNTADVGTNVYIF